MSRYEGEFNAVAAAPFDIAAELRGEIGRKAAGKRTAAIACCLSASDGWRTAARTLGGAFADDATRTRLTAAKEE